MERKKIVIGIALVLILAALTGCTTTSSTNSATISSPAEVLNAKYTPVSGYDFVFTASDDVITCNFIDIYSEEEIDAIASDLLSLLPDAEGYDYSFGKIEIKATVSQAEFEKFVSDAEGIIYDLFF